jgi:hypothetical protein
MLAETEARPFLPALRGACQCPHARRPGLGFVRFDPVCPRCGDPGPSGWRQAASGRSALLFGGVAPDVGHMAET